MRYSPEYMMSYSHKGGFMEQMSFFAPSFGLPLFLLCIALVLALKGYCLWHASKRNEKWWFIALLAINTFGILEIFYILFVLKKIGSQKCECSHADHCGHNHEYHHDHNHEHSNPQK